MIFYEIELLSQPKILLACNVRVEKSTNCFDHRDTYIEMCVIEEGYLRHTEFDGKEEVLGPGMLTTIAKDSAVRTASLEGQQHCHTTVGMIVSYRCRRIDSKTVSDVNALKEKIKKGNVFLVPYRWKIDEIYYKAIQLITEISRLHNSQSPAATLDALGKLYALTGLFTDYVLRQLEAEGVYISASEQRCARHAVAYIEKHYQRRLPVCEIAESLQVSEGHLHRIFKKVKGIGITEYINRHRVNVALSLIEKRGLSLKEAAYNVGIEDPAYMSRLFKKVTGTNYRNYEKTLTAL